jgi:hypothetical protein
LLEKAPGSSKSVRARDQGRKRTTGISRARRAYTIAGRDTGRKLKLANRSMISKQGGGPELLRRVLLRP